MSQPFAMRDMRPTDESFVMRSWKLMACDLPPMNVIADYHQHVVLQHLKERIEFIVSHSVCRVACSLDDDNQIIGFVVADVKRKLVHFVFVKSAFRRLGVANALLADVGDCKTATTWSRACEDKGPERGYSYKPSRIWPNPWDHYRRERDESRSGVPERLREGTGAERVAGGRPEQDERPGVSQSGR